MYFTEWGVTVPWAERENIILPHHSGDGNTWILGFLQAHLLLRNLNTFRWKSNLKWPQLRYFHKKPLVVKNHCLKSESPGQRTEDRETGRVQRNGHFLLFNGCIITKMSPIHDWRLWKQWAGQEATNCPELAALRKWLLFPILLPWHRSGPGVKSTY